MNYRDKRASSPLRALSVSFSKPTNQEGLELCKPPTTEEKALVGKFGDAVDRSMAAEQDRNRLQNEAAKKAATERAAKLKLREDWFKNVFDPVCDAVNADLRPRGAQLLTRSIEDIGGMTITATLSRAAKPPNQTIIKVDNDAGIRFDGKLIGSGREPLEDAFVAFIERTFGGSDRPSIPD
ncbi:hypothetical protein A1D31_21680 [Bradyrhizobium liaoningense]|nr:hypothetical protein A1D31_21680 [Bradyrhizobium liaoningense]